MSNLGGGQSLGLEETYATAYSSYLTVEKAFEKFSGLFAEAGCAGDSKTTASAAQIDCLKKVDAAKLVAQPTVARYVVQDGAIVTTPELPLSGKPGAVANVPVIFGVTSDDGASFTTYPKTPVASLEEGIMVGLGISKEYAQMVLASGLFNLTNPTGNVTLDAFNITQRVSTDLQFRCVDQATVYAGALSKTFPAAYYYELTRTIGGYDPNNLGGPPGNDPNAPYFRLHGGDAPWILGILRDPRNSDDLYSVQASVDVFGAFIRTGDPNPTMQFMRYRGYEEVDDMLAQYAGPWQKVNGPDEKANVRLLDWPAASTGWVDEAQCKFLNYTITSFYVK